MNQRFYQFVVIALLLTQMGVVMGLVSPNLSDTDLAVVSDQVHLPVVISTALIYLLMFVRLFMAPRRFLAGIQSIRLLLPLLLFTVMSAVWSTAPSMTMRRSLFFLLSTAVALILGTEFAIPELINLFGAASLIHIALCVVCMIFAPHFVYSPSDPHALKGLTTHKNVFGLELGLATLSLLLVPFPRLVRFRIPFSLLAFGMLLLSHSAGSLVATVAALCSIPLLLTLRLPGVQRVPILLGALFIAGGTGYWLFEHAELIPALLSKDATLTGRTELWSLILIAIRNHPLLGYGFDSFWQGLQGDSLTIISQVGWLVPTAHNGYLDLLLSIGWLGVALFIPFCLQTIRRCLSYAAEASRQVVRSASLFPFALLTFLLVYNLNESALLTRSGMPFMLWVAVSASIGIRQAARRTERVAAAVPSQFGPQYSAGAL